MRYYLTGGGLRGSISRRVRGGPGHRKIPGRAVQPRQPAGADGAHRGDLCLAGGRGARAGAAVQGCDPEIPVARREAARPGEAEAAAHRPQGIGEEAPRQESEEGQENRQEKEARMRVAATALAAALAATPAFADFNDSKPITATVTGATPSGYPRTMVEGMNAVVRDAYPGSSVSFKPNSPGGGVLDIGEGRADFTATATGTEIRLANEGQSPYPKPLKGKFSYVMMLYDNQFMHFLMTREWADANGIKSWEDIAKKKPKIRLAINRPDNPQTTIGGPYEVMKAYGFTIQDIEKWGGSYVLGNSSIGLDAIVDGKADVFMNARNLGDALVKDVASKRALLWIDGDRAHFDKAAATFSNRTDFVPKDTYPFMDKEGPTVRMW